MYNPPHNVLMYANNITIFILVKSPHENDLQIILLRNNNNKSLANNITSARISRIKVGGFCNYFLKKASHHHFVCVIESWPLSHIIFF